MNTTLRTKIVWTFAILVTLSLAGSFWAIYNFYAMGTTVATILRENYQSVLAAENMVKALERQDNALLALTEGEDTTMGGPFDDNKNAFFTWQNQAAPGVTGPATQTILDSIRTSYQSYVSYADSTLHWRHFWTPRTNHRQGSPARHRAPRSRPETKRHQARRH